MKTFFIDVGLVLIGFLIGRFTAPRGRTTDVYKPRPGGPASADKAGGSPADAEIEAIRIYRKAYGTDLKDAKDAVEALKAQLGD